MEGPIGNWVWLADFAGRRAALCVGDAGDRMAEALSCYFEQTWVAEARPGELARLQARLAPLALAVKLVRVGPEVLPLRAGSLDCITLHGLFDWWPREGTPAERSAARDALLAQCRRALRPGGCLYVGHANRPWRMPWKLLARSSARRGPSPGEMALALRRAGLRRVRSFYADPSHMDPRYVIPRTRQAVLACERALARELRRSPLRRSLAALGLHGVLYGGALHLANA